jgi:hypothetical protein
MDRRHLKVLMVACLGLVLPGVQSLRSQEPRGPGPGPRELRPPPPFGEQEAFRRMQQLPAEEQETFKHNLEVWRGLPPDEKAALRTMARTRARAEIDKAIQDSGLHLDPDQREVFALRYTQERRKLERDLQHQAAAERALRMPEILSRLRSEFGGTGGPAPKPAATSPTTEAKPETSAAPAAAATPAVSR